MNNASHRIYIFDPGMVSSKKTDVNGIASYESATGPHGTIERNPSVERKPFYWDDKVYGPD